MKSKQTKLSVHRLSTWSHTHMHAHTHTLTHTHTHTHTVSFLCEQCNMNDLRNTDQTHACSDHLWQRSDNSYY